MCIFLFVDDNGPKKFEKTMECVAKKKKQVSFTARFSMEYRESRLAGGRIAQKYDIRIMVLSHFGID